MKPLLSTLTLSQTEALIALCEEFTYEVASKQALETLNLKISAASLYTRHKIAEDHQTRIDYSRSGKVEPNQILRLAADQLQLRLLELASRPNPGASELRALFQIITRLEALKPSKRRVMIAEKREARMEAAQISRDNPPRPEQTIAPQEDLTVYVKRMLGKQITDTWDSSAASSPNEKCPTLNDQRSMNPAPHDQRVFASPPPRE